MKARIATKSPLEIAFCKICDNMTVDERCQIINNNKSLTPIQRMILKKKIRKIYRKANQIKKREGEI